MDREASIPIDVRMFNDWRQEYPDMYVLNLRSGDSMLHRASCHHFNQATDRKYRTKWVSSNLESLRKRAKLLGLPCRETCDCLAKLL